MLFNLFKKSKIALLFFTFLFCGCSYHKIPITLQTGTNNFHSLVSTLVDDSATKIKKNIKADDIILVSDFVNINNLKNNSQLGFLLSSMLKDKLVSLDIIVKEIQLGKEFEFGKSGFNMLSREKRAIANAQIEEERFAVVGTYSLTTKSLNVFIKLIDIRTGHILSSSYERTDIDEEILNLEGEEKKLNLRPRVVL